MKSKFYLLSFVLMFFYLCIPFNLFAQTGDTVFCNGATYGAADKLRAYIAGDTLASGLRKYPNRVYKLERGQIYWFSGKIICKGNLAIIADDDNSASPKAPPIFMPWTLQDGTADGNYIDHRKGNLTLKNLYFSDWVYDATYANKGRQAGWDYAVWSSADSSTIKISKCVFDGQEGGHIDVEGNWVKIYITDCYFKNGIHPGGSYYGGGNILRPANRDTLIVTNNTFFCNSGYVFYISGIRKHVRFEHNNVLFNVVNVLPTWRGSNDIIKNNIYYCAASFGSNKNDGMNIGDTSAVFQIDSLSGTYGWGTPNPASWWDTTMTDARRKMSIHDNVYFWPKEYYDQCKIDTVIPTIFMDGRAKQIFASKSTFPGFFEYNNKNLDPGFGTDVTNQVAPFITYMHKIWSGTQDNFQYLYSPSATDIISVPWPLKENFKYSQTLLGDDGLPLGDLNAYPEKRKLWNMTTGVDTKKEAIPEKYTLSQNYPNPFNPSTTIKFSIPVTGNVSLKVFNTLGQVVATLVDQNLKAGNYDTYFDGKGLSSGVYFYTLKANGNSITNKMMLVK
jgi:hypothetical protein